MRYVPWILLALALLLFGSFLHYVLPQHDIVRVVNTEVRRVTPGGNALFWSTADTDDASGTRDVLFIETIRPNGNPSVYRNEDTGLVWPPYFKFDSANVQAVGQDLESTQANPRWVAVRHYGWRMPWFSIFPNATTLWEVESENTRIIPYFNIIFLLCLSGALFWLWRVWRGFREDRIDPVLADIDEAVEETRARGRGFWRRITGR